MKRFLSMVLAVCLCLSLFPTVTMQADALSPKYTVSSAYKSSSYYTALCKVSLTGNQREDIVNVALSQVGYREGSSSGDYGGADDGSYNNYTEYNYWYHNHVSSGMPVGGSSAPWCATFVSWCAEQANVPSSILKRSTAAGHGASYFNINFYSGSSTLASSGDNDSYFKGYNYTPKKGDLFYTRSWSHVGLVVGVNGSYVTTVEGNTNNNGSSEGNGVYQRTRKITDLYFGVPNYIPAEHTCDKGTYVYYEAAHPHYKCYKCSVCGQVWRNTAEPTTVSSCSSCVQRTIDSRYSSYLPMGAFPISDSNISVYDAYGTKYSNRYISGASDVCLIWEIYTDGWCKVSYPSSVESSGSFTAYTPISVFISSPSLSSWTSNGEYTAYRKSNMSSEIGGTLGTVTNGAKCLRVSQSGSLMQVVYPVSGREYSMMGWIAEPKQIHSSTSTVELALGGTASQTIYAWSTGYYNGNTALYCSRSNSNVSCSWGEWTNGKAPLTITANATGTTTLTLGVEDSDTGEILSSMTVTIKVGAKTYTITFNSNGGTNAPNKQTKYHGTPLTLSSEKPSRDWYTFVGWSESNSTSTATYKPGDKYNDDYSTTLYAVWKLGCEGGNHTFTSKKMISPTCTAQGYTTYFCPCGYSYRGDYTTATGHSYDYKVFEEPTTSTTGIMKGFCSECSSTTTVTLPKLSTTDYTQKVTKAATCTSTGNREYTWKTTTYGVYAFDVAIPAMGHSYNAVVTHPTTTANGYTKYTCKSCGHSYKGNYTFIDVPTSFWSYESINFAVAKGYFSGYANGKFGPTDNISRQDFVVVLARIAGVDLKKYSGRTGFPDVKAGDYYEAAVKWASYNGVVSGYNNGTFGVGEKITREQLVTILYRYAQKMGYDTKVSSGATAKFYKFGDAGKVSSYARTAVIWALDKGIISGMTASTIGPQNNASRGQVATILMNISKKNIMPI